MTPEMEELGMIPFLLGLFLGLMMILPIGAQSLFVINQGLLIGFPRAWVAMVTVCCCDSFLIVLGAAGASALLVALGYREVLIVLGSAFLVVVGLLTLRARPPQHADAKRLTHIGVTVSQAVGVSVLNPTPFSTQLVCWARRSRLSRCKSGSRSRWVLWARHGCGI